jgi:hypothetical protein
MNEALTKNSRSLPIGRDPVSRAGLHHAAVTHAGPVRTRELAVAALYAKQRQDAVALRRPDAELRFLRLRRTSGAKERADCDCGSKQQRTSRQGLEHDFVSPIRFRFARSSPDRALRDPGYGPAITGGTCRGRFRPRSGGARRPSARRHRGHRGIARKSAAMVRGTHQPPGIARPPAPKGRRRPARSMRRWRQTTSRFSSKPSWFPPLIATQTCRGRLQRIKVLRQPWIKRASLRE